MCTHDVYEQERWSDLQISTPAWLVTQVLGCLLRALKGFSAAVTLQFERSN